MAAQFAQNVLDSMSDAATSPAAVRGVNDLWTGRWIQVLKAILACRQCRERLQQEFDVIPGTGSQGPREEGPTVCLLDSNIDEAGNRDQ
jgi:hypothetical protein